MTVQYWRIADGLWRTDDSKPHGQQVQFQMHDGEWWTSILPTAVAFLDDTAGAAVPVDAPEVSP
jgi:hypothetical protein